VRPRDLVDHGETESRAGFAAGDVFPRKGLDQRIGTAGANTGAPIRDGQDKVVIVPARGNLYFLLAVTQPVVHEIRDQSPDAHLAQIRKPHRLEHRFDIVP
jgi:hypothetical protein